MACKMSDHKQKVGFNLEGRGNSCGERHLWHYWLIEKH